ncbi:MAG: DUF3536 domain-containing protein [Chloroflexota bacterium]|nr:MAG: DUF3536 domain-containing protein [Chloroflexota bacterium]
MADRYLCVHGHFYQPPRENPFTLDLPRETGAEPYHDFNQKINAECYRPNSVLGNFEHLSFDLGPTLSTWLEQYDPETYSRIVAAERANYQRHGCGNGMAQSYNHTILPLDNRRDKQTQVYWGIADFWHRFGHAPEGMWLPEAAVDMETLEVLTENDICFTILGQSQAIHDDLDTSRPYLLNLSNGSTIAALFFDAPVSFQVSFIPEATLDADAFMYHHVYPRHDWASRGQQGDKPFLLMATDGELYGHHAPLRELFLEYLFRAAAPQAGFETIYPARYLRLRPPRDVMVIREHTSWSCAHGIERWNHGCSCTEGDSSWKRPFREALNTLAREIDALSERETRLLLRDFWGARDRYIWVRLGDLSRMEYLAQESARNLTSADEQRIISLMEAQYFRQYMFTSCPFFWEDPSREEAQHSMACAARAIDLVRQVTGISLEVVFRSGLSRVWSQQSGQNGDHIYQRMLLEQLGPTARAA